MKFIMHFPAGLVAYAITILLVTGNSLRADEKTWTGAIDGSWLNGGNWSPSALVTDLDSVLYDSSSTANLTQTLDQNWNITGLRVTSAPGPITILPGAGSFVLTNTAIDMSVADVDLTILADYGAASSSASLTVAAGRTLTLSNSITAVTAGSIGGAGTVRITGASQRMNDQLNAITFIVDGGSMVGNPPVRLSADSGSTVTVLVTNNGSMTVSSGNAIRVRLGNLPIVSSTNRFILDGGTVTVLGSTSSSASGFYVGDAADTIGILDINNGTIDLINNPTQDSVVRLGNSIGSLGIVNLNANGRLLTRRIDRTGSGYAIFNFNGGYFQAAATDHYFQSVDEINLLAGGAVIDTVANGRLITIDSSLAGVGGLTKIGLGTLTLATTNTYAGPTTVSNGILNVNLPMSSSAIMLASNTSLSITVGGISNASWSPSAITLQSSNVLTFTFAPDSQASSTLLNTTTLSVNGTNVINIGGAGWPAGTIRLIDYSGSINGGGTFTLGSLPVGLNARLTNNTSTTSIDLVVSSGVNNLDWYGYNASGSFGGLWDIATSFNWNGGANVYNEYGSGTNQLGDSVRFTSTGNLTVEIATNVRPSSVLITNLNTGTYSFVGPGKISGPTSVTKDGNNANSTVSFATTNDYTGGTFLRIGILRIDVPNALPTAGIFYLGSPGNGATFQLNGNDQTIAGLVSTGSGSGNRRIFNGAGTPATFTINVAANQTNVYAHTLGQNGMTDVAENLYSVVKSGPGIQTFSGTSAYRGTTTISGGTLLFNNCTSTNMAGTVTVQTGGTLAHVGTGATALGAPVVVESGGRLEPGNFGIGTMTVSNAVTLQGEALMQISRPTSADRLIATNISLGGTLTVTNIGAALLAGDSFTLFSGPLTGTFSSVVLPPLSSNLGWNTNNLTVNGTLSVYALPIPSFTSQVISGGSLILSGTGGPTNGTYYVLTSTNVTNPVSAWTPIITNTFSASGGFNFTNALDPAVPQQFYLLQIP